MNRSGNYYCARAGRTCLGIYVLRLKACSSARFAIAIAIVVSVATRARAEDVSQPAMLQMFEAKWSTIEDRMPDVFQTGYGQMWLPPPQRADSGGVSVGYDVFNRFDLGQARNETLYGTESSLKGTVTEGHRAGVSMYTDFVANHNGYGTQSNTTFVAQGGYPGFAMSVPGDQFGDFHDPSITYQQDEKNGSLFGLIDIAQEKNNQYVRQPTTAGNPNNLPAGTLYNKPDPNNARFYPDQALGGITLNDPNTVGSFTRYFFNNGAPLAGDPVKENAVGLMMRNMQWMIQTIGVDGFRMDAARHFPSSVMNSFDDAVYHASLRTNFDGTIKPIFMFSEIADGSASVVMPYYRRDLPNRLAITPSDTTVHGNRDVLDFPLFYAMVSNLTGNGAVNNWHNIQNASVDIADDGLHNGSAGVTFVDSHDNQSSGFPALTNVAYAYSLMLPGNSIVYLNAKQFGDNRAFPRDQGGAADPVSNNALGGSYWGDAVTKLVSIRNSYGRGDFHERWIDDAFNPNGFSNVYVYERSKSAVVALNSRNDSFVETRNGVQTDFAPGTILVELTGNAADPSVDPSAVIPDTIKVDGSGKVNLSIPSNNNGQDKGYLIYGVASPQGTLSLSNRGTNQVLAGAAPSISNTARLSAMYVVTSNSFTAQLNTTPVSLQDPDHPGQFVRDVHADGDTAMIKIDDGVNINGVPGIDNTTPGNVGYGFENFVTARTPGFIWNGAADVGTGSGTYAQTIDTTQLSEGRHYITVRAFRHRDSATGGDGGPSVFTDFRQTIYVDRLPPVSAMLSFNPFASQPSNPNNRDMIVNSVDGTASSMNIFMDLPASLTQADILQRAQQGLNQAGYYDQNQFVLGFSGLTTGNHVATIVTFEPTGNFSIQRVPGQYTATNIGGGFGDMNSDKIFSVSDVRCSGTTCNNGSAEDILYSQNTKFKAAFDVNGDGLSDNRDLFALGSYLVAGGASQDVLDSYTDLLLHRADVNGDGVSDAADVTAVYSHFGPASWTYDMNVDGTVNVSDVSAMVTQEFRTKPGDFNLDGSVDAADYVIWRKSQGTGTMYTQGDANFDGTVDANDLAVWRRNYGFSRQPLTPGSGASVATVPEADTVALVVVAALLLPSAMIRLRTKKQLEQRLLNCLAT